MLQYLTMNTRPDISFSVSQVSRFTRMVPRRAMVLLKASFNNSSTLRIKEPILTRMRASMTLLMTVSSWSAFWWMLILLAFTNRTLTNPRQARSPALATFIIHLVGAPLIWKSKLQTEISLSTLESEYSALSQAMCQLIPIHLLIIELLSVMDDQESVASSISCTVFEDNNGTLASATNQHITTRTKYFHVK
jgi:hypothetical protein